MKLSFLAPAVLVPLAATVTLSNPNLARAQSFQTTPATYEATTTSFANGEYGTIRLYPGYGFTLDFSQTGQVVQRAWLDDMSLIGIDFSNGTAESIEAQFVHLKLIPEVNFQEVLRYMASLFDRWQQENILTIMAGYRDLSMLTSRGFKDIFKARTARLGLLWLIKDIEEQIGQIDRMETAKVLYEFGWKPISADDCLPLTRVMSSHMKLDDARLIAKAIKVSRRKYREYIEKILRSISFSYDIMLVAGGTGDFLAQAIVEGLGTSTLLQPDPLINRIINEYGFERAEAVRLADIFAIAFMNKSAVRALA